MSRLKLFAILLALCGQFATDVTQADQNVVVVLDDSGSMNERMSSSAERLRRIDAAKKALAEVLGNLPKDTSVGVLALNTNLNGSNWIVPFGPVDSTNWRQNIAQLQADGGTPLGEFLKLGTDRLLEARGKKVYGSFRLLVVTDGEANDAGLVDAYLPDILSRGIVMDVIGVDMQADHSLATRVHNYRRADDDAALQAAISEVFAETSTDDQDAAADFEMLASLPEGFAEMAIKSLAARGNQPIEGQNQAPRSGLDFGFSSSPSSGGNSGAGTAFGGAVCCLGGFGALILLASIIFRSRKPPRRRR